MAKKDINISVELSSWGIIVKFNNRRIFIYPDKNGGIQLVFKRVVTKEEREQIKNNTAEIVTASSTIVGGKVLKTGIGLSFETCFVLSNVLETYQREIMVRQMINTIVKKEERREACEVLDSCSHPELLQFIDYYENNRDMFFTHLNDVKKKLIGSSTIEPKDTDIYGKS